jgi:putative FmdB family regulatory protein
MPIYEYEPIRPGKGCEKCTPRFEIIQGYREDPLRFCPACGHRVRKIISWCRSAVVEVSEEQTRMEKKISEYETAGMWSHAAELADSRSEKTEDPALKIRALENYEKAGYDTGSLEKHLKES